MNTNSFKHICEIYLHNEKNGACMKDTAGLMFQIASTESKSKTNNVFEKMGEFLVNNSEFLEQKFDKDYQYGACSTVPDVSKFIWSEFQKYKK
jgi:hypothetical protein